MKTIRMTLCPGFVMGLLLLSPMRNRAADVPPAPAVAAGQAADNVFRQDFNGDKDLAALGWTIDARPDQSEWRIVDGHLEAVCHRNPYKGGLIRRHVPVLDRGVLEFDAKFAVHGLANYNHFSLGFKLYNHMTAFKRLGRHRWMAYKPKTRQWPMLCTTVPLDEWVHVKMVFDRASHRAEYYVGEADDPVYVDPDFAFPEKASDELVFFNYGLCSGTVTHWIDNVALRKEKGGGDGGTTLRTRAVIFRGISYDRYGVRAVLEKAVGSENVSVYTMQTRGAAIMPRNQFALDRLPSANRLHQAAWIVLVDIPFGPRQCFPPFVLRDIRNAVEDGAALTVLGGLFAFGKGEYGDSALGDVLPAIPRGRWEVKRFDRPRAIEPVVPGWPVGNGKHRPGLLFYHEVSLRPKAEVLLRAGGKPLLVRKARGKGTVTAFLGTTCGTFTDQKGLLPFWCWPGWPQWVREIIGISDPDKP